MKISNIRQFSTPLIIGAGIFVATTGVFMFVTTIDLVRFAHEILGVCFAVAILLHIMTNWRPFKRYFFKKNLNNKSDYAQWLIPTSPTYKD